MRQTVGIPILLPLLAAGLLTGCEGASSSAGLDCRDPFPELAATADSTSQPAGAPSQPAGKLPSVPLAGRLAADLAGDGWRVFGDETVTVLLHIASSGRPDALVYTEAFPAAGRARPSEEAARFLLTVDPTLLRNDWSRGEASAALAAKLQGTSPADQRNLRAVAGMAMTRTGGRGLGYVSEPASFSGWRWIGRNPQGTLLRLARSTGRWGEQGFLAPALRSPVDRLVQKFPQTEWMKSGLQSGGETGGGGSHAAAPASMVFGSARSSAGEVHLALLCMQAPTCDAAPALASLLSSVRPISRDDLDNEETLASPEALMIDAEILIAPQPGVLTAP